jgi:uncharacterized membrane protein
MDLGLMMIIISVIACILNLFNIFLDADFAIGYKSKRSKSSGKNWQLAQFTFWPLVVVLILITMFFYNKNLMNNAVYTVLCLIDCLIAAIITEYILSRKMAK